MRGNRREGPVVRGSRRSIPAHAGEPFSDLRLSLLVRVYPRACGGTFVILNSGDFPRGLSPRMRGNHPHDEGRKARMGSIPAHAGEPWRCRHQHRPRRVYPRACGGTPGYTYRVYSSWGLSPRMRGNLGLHHLDGVLVGSIPAHAGEPLTGARWVDRGRVYPRACGGTRDKTKGGLDAEGLSPRMRGNHKPGTFKPRQMGSIPAHAGEPSRQVPNNARKGGSIPAHAGEPWSLPGTLRGLWVYPRACGGTGGGGGGFTVSVGLSPRMRGNPLGRSTGIGGVGSIPAHAGEP